MSFKRKAQRDRLAKDKKIENAFKKKLMMFDRLPDHCLACETDFDKKSREMVTTWNVVVREEVVRLYCPECWQKAQDVAEQFMKKKEAEAS